MRRSAAALLVLSLAACSRGAHAPGAGIAPRLSVTAGPRSRVTGAKTPPPVTAPASPLGSAPRPVAEPAAIDRSTPAALLASLGAALGRHDAAALARVRLAPSEKPALDEHDARRAALDFLSPGLERYWKRVLAAADTSSVASSGTTGLVHADLGGSLGVVTLRLERARDGWVLR